MDPGADIRRKTSVSAASPSNTYGNLSQRAAFGHWKEEPNGRDHGREHGDVDKVENPLDCLERDGVDVLIEEAGGKHGRQVGR